MERAHRKWFCMGNVAATFSVQISLFFKTSDCHKISSFKDGGLKFGHFDILDMLFHFWHLLIYSP